MDNVRGTSFGAVAEDYERYRPRLPEQALDWLLPAESHTALDLGAGTGAATSELARKVDQVIAVEPDPRMRQLIRRHAPQARVVAGRAESLPLEDASVDIVLVCSAWHWMDPDLAVPEIARVLRGGGVWGVLWNSLDREVPWVAQLRRVAGQPHSSEEENRRRRPEHIRLPFDAPFGAAEMRDIRWTWNITREHLLGLVGTYSSVIALDPREQAEVLAGARDLIDTLNLRPGGRIPVPMACRCWKAIRI